mgnify:CR=1 FL=1
MSDKKMAVSKPEKKPRIKKSLAKSEKVSKDLNLETEDLVTDETKDVNVAKQNSNTSDLSNSETFDWDKISDKDKYTNDQRVNLEKEYISTLPEVVAKQVIDGVVVLITDREVVVDINFKSDGVISFNEFVVPEFDVDQPEPLSVLK